jgi:transketolase
VLTRQKLPVIDRKEYGSADLVKKGGYILADAANGKPQIILIATGSEVTVALKAWEQLGSENIAARVVSLPSWEIFEKQSQAYRDEVLPPAIKARIAIEAASPFGWSRYVGDQGSVIGMKSFGASAPVEVLMEKFGFTSENVVAQAKDLLRAPKSKP